MFRQDTAKQVNLLNYYTKIQHFANHYHINVLFIIPTFVTTKNKGNYLPINIFAPTYSKVPVPKSIPIPLSHIIEVGSPYKAMPSTPP